MIVATIFESDFVYKADFQEEIFYFDRIIGRKYTKIVVSKDMKGNLYVVTDYSHSFDKTLDSRKSLIYIDLSEVC